MASYATFLFTGQTLLCKSILSATVKQYLKAVADLFVQQDLFNPLLTKRGCKSQLVQAVTHEAKRWESVPNRREPLTIPMGQSLVDQAASSSPDSAASAISD